jgi:predicted nucleic acid-binding protein
MTSTIEAMRVGFDTNILIYAEGFNDRPRVARARQIRGALGEDRIVLPSQVIGELFNALTRKLGVPRSRARDICLEWCSTTSFRLVDAACWDGALTLAATHGLQFWDALILATAAEAGCALLLSEDMQDGFVHRGVTIANPFADPLHPLLVDALRHRG